MEENKKYHGKKVIDLGCGNGKIEEYFTLFDNQKRKSMFESFHSFDYQKIRDFIIKADIKKLPLEDQSVNVAIFCLSLMGKNYL